MSRSFAKNQRISEVKAADAETRRVMTRRGLHQFRRALERSVDGTIIKHSCDRYPVAAPFSCALESDWLDLTVYRIRYVLEMMSESKPDG